MLDAATKMTNKKKRLDVMAAPPLSLVVFPVGLLVGFIVLPVKLSMMVDSVLVMVDPVLAVLVGLIILSA